MPIIPDMLVDFSTPKTPDGKPEFAPIKSFELTSLTVVSIDFARKKTWWFGSDRIDEVDVSSSGGLGLIYNLQNSELIDIYSISEGVTAHDVYDPSLYRMMVTKDGNDITDKEYGYDTRLGIHAPLPAANHSDAYKVDYENGIVTFDNDQSAHQIDISYSIPNAGNFQLTPPPDKKWRVNHIELQFSKNHTAWDSPMEFVVGVNYDLTGNTDVEAKVKTYRGMRDILNYANLGTEVPACGELTDSSYQIPFSYITGFTIVPRGVTPATGNTMNYMELRMKYDLPIPNCEIATASFYIIEEDL